MVSEDPLHPWPGLTRTSWCSLNGAWEFSADLADRGLSEGWSGGGAPWDRTIVVPFAWSSLRSGIATPWLSVGWYRRRISRDDLPPDSGGAPDGTRTVVVFGAVHHHAMVWVDGVLSADHVGGSQRFECDITDALAASGERPVEVVVRVEAPTDKRSIPHGKQRSIPTDDFDPCCFTPTSGIWQEVWIERRPDRSISALSLRPSDDLRAIEVVVRLTAAGGELTVAAHTGEHIAVPADRDEVRLTLPIDDPRLWSPDHPFLYQFTAELVAGGSVDRVSSRTGLRRFEFSAGALHLNGQRIYLRGVLDQGYWPETGLTADSTERLRTDLELAKRAGFNFIRKHLKFEDPRQIALADELGLLMWVEPPSYSVFSEESAELFRQQIPEMIDRYGNSPSVIVYGLYNEEWGFRWQVAEEPRFAEVLSDVAAYTRELDPGRAVIDNSGWTHVSTDLMDWHAYNADLNQWRTLVETVAAGGLQGLDVGTTPANTRYRPLQVGSQPDPAIPVINSEYGVGLTSLERAWHLKWQTLIMRAYDANHGYVYCELTDIEHETAGLYAEYRTPKDLGTLNPADVHADTVIIPLIDPVAPGVDLTPAPDAELVFGVRVSHHGSETIDGNLTCHWVTEPTPSPPAAVTVTPFQCSPTIMLTAPPRTRAAPSSSDTLVVQLQHHDGHRVTQVHLDVTFVSPEPAGAGPRPLDQERTS